MHNTLYYLKSIAYLLFIIYPTLLSSQKPPQQYEAIDKDFCFIKGEQTFSENFDSSEYYFLCALPNLKSQGKWIEYVKSLSYLASIYYQKSNFSLTTSYILKAAEMANIKLPDTNLVYISAAANLAGFHRAKGNYRLALNQYSEVLMLLNKINKQKGNHHKILILKNVSLVYNRIGDFDEAILTCVKSQKLLEDSPKIKNRNKEFGAIFRTMGNIYFEMGNFKQAAFSYNRSDSLYSVMNQVDFIQNMRFRVQNHMAKSYLALKNIDSSYYYINKALPYTANKNTTKKYLIFENLGTYYQYQKQYKQAKDAFQKAIDIAIIENSEHKVLKATARQFSNLAQLEFESQNYREAAQNYQYSLNNLFYAFKETDIYQAPNNLGVIPILRDSKAWKERLNLFSIYIKKKRTRKTFLRPIHPTFSLPSSFKRPGRISSHPDLNNNWPLKRCPFMKGPLG